MITGLFSAVLILLAPMLSRADGEILAPGYGLLEFPAPAPNTYSLPPLGNAVDGQVVDTSGKSVRLHELFDDRIVLLSFIYSSCDDINGCPLATAVLHKVTQKIEERIDAAVLRVISLSFDPRHDTPEVLRRYGEYFQRGSIDWRFVTTAGEDTLEPILKGYDQSVAKVLDEAGNDTGKISHILRVFLIDRNKKIRNIYSTSFLHADTLISDIETLQIEDAASTEKVGLGLTQAVPFSSLLQWVKQPPLGLPSIVVPENNPVTESRVSLGRKLFFDRRLSFNETMSCAMCHIPEQGFTNNEMATAVGIEGRTVRRNAPTLYNVAHLTRLFLDSREYSLEQQVWGPLLATNEMGNPSVGYVIEKLHSLTDYKGLFETAFNKPAAMETVGAALASFERTLNSADSSFDRWYFGQQSEALNTQARAGFEVFTGKGNCSGCHSINSEHALFTDNRLHNTGIGYRAAMHAKPLTTRVQLGPGQFVDIDTDIVDSVSEVRPNDLGRYEITQSPKDRWKYRTPSLRNIALTAPYMHDGSLPTLREVIEFYDRGGAPNENQDRLIRPLNLNTGEKNNLVMFLQSLTGSNVEALVSSAQAVGAGDRD
ncbi:MAG: cytochrome c peroxidase [Porticoccaceae bacterium]